MTEQEFLERLDALSVLIGKAAPARQHLFQADLHRLAETALAAGVKLPERARLLDEQLTDAAIEAQFDNLPV